MKTEDYAKKYRQILIRLNREKIFKQYQVLLRGKADEKRLNLLTIDEENNWLNIMPIIDETTCSNHSWAFFRFDDKTGPLNFIKGSANQYNNKYLLRIETVVPSYYILDTLDELNLSFDYYFASGIISVLTNNQRIEMEWGEYDGEPMFEINVYTR